MENREVLISGAGLGGPALAYWLRRHGFRPTVVEKAPGLRDGGYKVDVRGAAIEVLRRMGLLDAVRAADTDMQHISYVGATGRTFATLNANAVMGRRGDDREIMRADLTRILYDATRDDVEYVFDDAIATLDQHPDGVDVTFERGAPRRFGLVIGADGLHSATRRLAFDGADPLVHLGSYISIFTVPNHLRLDRREMMHNAPGRLVFLYSTGPDAPAKAGFAFASPPLAYDRRDVDAQKRLVAERFAGLGWEVPRLLDAMADADDFYLDSMSQTRLDRWSTGRVALIGDAASCPSPASGQGTSLALVGAYVLAGELAAAGGEHRAAFDGYETRMRPYVEANLAFGVKMAAEMVPGSRWQVALRNYAMRTMRLNPFAPAIIERMLRPLHVAANAIDLPAYPVSEHAS
jgi:2-polyprenyl-6-methoxyphenol hydroxylase-like FAD-dependent oxidoreductase